MLNQVYELETALLRTQRNEQELRDAVSKAKYDLRTARQDQIEYGSTFRAFLDRFSGKRADKEEQLSREVRKAEAELNSLQRRLETETAKLSALKEQRRDLPPAEQLRTPENEALWATLESRYCAEALLPLLKETADALEEYRKMLRGEFPVLSIQRQQEIAAEPILCAQNCRPLLERFLAAQSVNGKAEELPAFFQTPDGFLAAAAKHNQVERAFRAQEQLLAMQNKANALCR